MDDKMIDFEPSLKIINRIENTKETYTDFNTRFHIVIPWLNYNNYKNRDENGNEIILYELPISVRGKNNKNNTKKADLCILNETTRKPEIIIECKNSNENLNDCVNQLEGYMFNCDTVDLGMLVKYNEFRFYKKSETKKEIYLFWIFDLRKLSEYDKDTINYCRNHNKKLLATSINLKQLLLQTEFYDISGGNYQSIINEYKYHINNNLNKKFNGKYNASNEDIRKILKYIYSFN